MRPELRPGRRALCAGLASVSLALLAGAPVAALAQSAAEPGTSPTTDAGTAPTPSTTPTQITQLRLERTGDDLYLSAAVRFGLPAAVLDVLDKGIALHFVAEAEVIRERWYWTDRQVAHAARHVRLAYQPLTRRWRLNVSPVPITNALAGITLNQNYDTLQEALEATGAIGRLRLGPVSEIGEQPAHLVAFRFRLDTSQLPRPFQIGVMGQSDWNVEVEQTRRLPVEQVP